MKHGQLWADGMLMFWERFPGLGLLWSYLGPFFLWLVGAAERVCCAWCPAHLADPEFVWGEGNDPGQ